MASVLKILFIHQNFPAQFTHLAPALAAQGAEVVALGLRNPAPTLPGVTYCRYRVPASSPERLRDMSVGEREWAVKQARGKAVAQAIGQLSARGFVPDVVMAHPGWGEAMFVKDAVPHARLGVYGEFYYAARGLDTDFDPEFADNERDQGIRLRLKNTPLLHALVSADAVLTPTAFQRSCHPVDFQPKIEVIHDGIDSARFRPDPAASFLLTAPGITLRAGDEVVTFVTRSLEPYRGYHILMRALPAILAARPRAHVVIVGAEGVSYGAAPKGGESWKQRFLGEVQARIDLRRVHFAGRLNHATLTQLLQVSAAHVYLTYPFVLSWSLLEAMSIGCLIVGSRTPPVEEVIRDGKNGVLVDFFDVDGLASTVIEALAKPERCRALRAAARETVVANYDLYRVCLPAQMRFVERLNRMTPLP